MYGYILEDGRESQESAKYKKAVKFGTKLVNEKQLSDYLLEKTNKALIEYIAGG